ncbi:MAG: class I SAM-dependent methyltransferase [Chloroflexota bacterium]
MMTSLSDSSSNVSNDYTRFGLYYDAIYAAIRKDYREETAQIHQIIQQYKQSLGNALLDLGCGTGGHAALLEQHYRVEGLDLSPTMLKIAQEHCPHSTFHQGDMTTFDLGRQFDVITCLFSAIGYVQTTAKLNETLQNISRHLLPGGVVVIEPWLSPEQFTVGHVAGVWVDQPDLIIARMNVGERQGDLSILDFYFMVATPNGVEYFTEKHELGLFSLENYLDAFKKSGLEVIHDPEGITGRGLFVGVRPV